ncbi:MAG: flavodoxin family protein [Eubacteriales bacterium]|nr:flavodoxin family protein [Eubacteriales bacterium]
MNVCILFASPRKDGNTVQLLKPFARHLASCNCQIQQFNLYDMHISPCIACRSCQQDWSAPNCCQPDDMQEIFKAVMRCDLLVLASPIYSWYCTPPMKCALDRLVYGMNKYYGDEMGPSIWAGKYVALLTTCGYRPDKGADLWEEGMKRYCKHSKLHYIGILAERNRSYQETFMDEEKAARAAQFAELCMDTIKNA